MESVAQEEVLMSDYRIEPNGTVVVFVSEKSTQRASGSAHPNVGARLAFKTKSDTSQFVRAGELEGFTFEGKEFLAA